MCIHIHSCMYTHDCTFICIITSPDSSLFYWLCCISTLSYMRISRILYFFTLLTPTPAKPASNAARRSKKRAQCLPTSRPNYLRASCRQHRPRFPPPQQSAALLCLPTHPRATTITLSCSARFPIPAWRVIARLRVCVHVCICTNASASASSIVCRYTFLLAGELRMSDSKLRSSLSHPHTHTHKHINYRVAKTHRMP